MKHVNVALFLPHVGCPHRCVFCDQNAITGNEGVPTPEEIDESCRIAAASPHDPAYSEIAFFGGSFTAVDRNLQETCLRAALPWIENGQFSGVRVSTRPDAVNEEILSFLKRYRVTAIELGAQSTDDGVLEKSRRGHTREDIFRAARLIRDAGFSLGLQMMTALPGATDETDRRTAEDFIVLSPDTVRVYPTLVLEGTALAKMYKSGEYLPPDFESQLALSAELLARFTEAGIRVIRLGLHASPSLESRLLAGAYHPAFREKAESRLWRRKIEEALLGKAPGHYIIYIDKTAVSKATGQKRENLVYFSAKGYDLKIRASESPEDGEIKIKEER